MVIDTKCMIKQMKPGIKNELQRLDYIVLISFPRLNHQQLNKEEQFCRAGPVASWLVLATYSKTKNWIPCLAVPFIPNTIYLDLPDDFQNGKLGGFLKCYTFQNFSLPCKPRKFFIFTNFKTTFWEILALFRGGVFKV